MPRRREGKIGLTQAYRPVTQIWNTPSDLLRQPDNSPNSSKLAVNLLPSPVWHGEGVSVGKMGEYGMGAWVCQHGCGHG